MIAPVQVGCDLSNLADAGVQPAYKARNLFCYFSATGGNLWPSTGGGIVLVFHYLILWRHGIKCLLELVSCHCFIAGLASAVNINLCEYCHVISVCFNSLPET